MGGCWSSAGRCVPEPKATPPFWGVPVNKNIYIYIYPAFMGHFLATQGEGPIANGNPPHYFLNNLRRTRPNLYARTLKLNDSSNMASHWLASLPKRSQHCPNSFTTACYAYNGKGIRPHLPWHALEVGNKLKSNLRASHAI